MSCSLLPHQQKAFSTHVQCDCLHRHLGSLRRPSQLLQSSGNHLNPWYPIFCQDICLNPSKMGFPQMLVIPQTSCSTESIRAHPSEKFCASQGNYRLGRKKNKNNLKLIRLGLVDSGPNKWLQLSWEIVQSERDKEHLISVPAVSRPSNTYFSDTVRATGQFSISVSYSAGPGAASPFVVLGDLIS